MSSFHTPVMLKECLRYLEPQDGGVYVDATLGGGGHSLAMLEAQPQARLYCFDQDEEAIEAAAQNLAQHCGQVDLIRANFSGIRTELALRQIKTIDGALFWVCHRINWIVRNADSASITTLRWICGWTERRK